MDKLIQAAAEWFCTPEECVTPEQRQEIKKMFGQLSFGGGSSIRSLRKITTERKDLLQRLYKQFDLPNANMLYNIRAFPYND